MSKPSIPAKSSPVHGTGRSALVWLLPTLSGCAFFVMLGLWQLDRAEQKRSILLAYATATAVKLEQVDADTPHYTRVTGAAKWLPQQLLLDNQTHKGKAGVHVFTPLLLNNKQLILVNRGWLPIAADRQQLPQPVLSAASAAFSGRTAPVPRPGLKLGAADVLLGRQWPQLVTYLDIEQLQTHYANVLSQPQLQMLPFIIKLDADSPAGFTATSSSPVNFGPNRHLAYAYTWFSLALTVLLTYLILNFRRTIPHE